MRKIAWVTVVLVLSLAGMTWADGGADCTSAPTINIPGDLPYADSGTTCGKGNTYDDACATLYGGGEDALYVLNVTVAGDYSIALAGTGTYTGFFVSDGCPDAMPTCTGFAVSGSGTNPSGMITFPSAGTYYLMIDTWPSPDCTAFDLSIDEPFAFTYTIDDACATSFEDISSSGTALGLSDDGEANIAVPFDFGFYGTIYTAPVDVRVGNNGAMKLNSTTGDIGTGSAVLPDSTMGLGIMPFADDIDSDSGDVYWEVLGTAPNRRLVVQWNNRPHYSNVGSATFEAVLYEATSEITFVYSDLDFGNVAYDSGASATVAVQDATKPLAHSYSINTVFSATCVNFTPEYVPVELQSFLIE